MKKMILMAKSMDDGGGGWMSFNEWGGCWYIETNVAIKYTLLSEDVVGLE